MANELIKVKGTPGRATAGELVPSGVMARAAQAGMGIWGQIKGVLGWMGPLNPVPQTAPPDVGARAFQYIPGYNLTTNQRTEPLSFATLKLLARNCDIVALAIETRKDQVVATNWEFRIKGQAKRSKGEKKDPRILELEQFFAMPDKDSNLPFKLWLRKWMDDSLIIDQPVIHIERNRGGKPYCFTIIDGQTIKPLLNEQGKPPRPDEGPAFQQWLYGSAAGSWTSDEMVVLPRNPRPDKIYGYSPVEQVYITANIAIRRQLKKLGIYTEGNIPEAMVPCPADWGPDQIAQFQLYFNATLSGQLGEQTRLRFMPAGMDKAIFPNDHKEDDVNGYDEYLVAIVMYAFSLPKTWATKAMNRASAEQAADSAEAEGVTPYLEFVKILFDILIFKGWGYTDIEFVPQTKREIDPLKQAQADEIRTKNGHLSVDEVREDLGEESIGQAPAVMTANGLVLIGKAGEEDAKARAEQAAEIADRQGQAGKGNAVKSGGRKGGAVEVDTETNSEAEKLAKANAKKKVKMLPMMGHHKVEKHLKDTLTKFLAKQGRKLGPALAKEYVGGKVSKVYMGGLDESRVIYDNLGKAAKKIDLTDWETLVVVFKPQLEAIAKRAALQALAQLEVTDEVTTESVSAEALAYANERAAELVGKKWDGTKLIDNPDARWAITDSTRDMLNESISAGIEDGLSADALAEKLTDSYAFSEERASMIARTELGMAHIQGNLEAWKGSGVVVGKQSILASNHPEEDVCNEAADDGVIPIDDLFSNGEEGPLYHPNCECALVAVLGERGKDELDEAGA